MYKKSKWLKVTQFKTEYCYTREGWELRLAGFQVNRYDLENLGIPLKAINGYLEDNKEKVFSLYMHGESEIDRNYKRALYKLIIRLNDSFYKKFGVKLWIDKSLLTEVG